MTRLLLKLVPVLTLVFALAAGAPRVLPADDSSLRAFLTPPAGCPAPCWQGIRPGLTSVPDAIIILENHPWVDHVIITESYGATGRGFIGWEWSGAQPEWINSQVNGALWAREGIVQSVRLETTIPVGQMWLLLARPPKGALRLEVDFTTLLPVLVYDGVYPDAYLALRAATGCPFRSTTFWRAETQLRYLQSFSNEFGDYALRDWLGAGMCG